MTCPSTRSEMSGRTPARIIKVLAVRRRSWIVQLGSGSTLVPFVAPVCMDDRMALSSLAFDRTAVLWVHPRNSVFGEPHRPAFPSHPEPHLLLEPRKLALTIQVEVSAGRYWRIGILQIPPNLLISKDHRMGHFAKKRSSNNDPQQSTNLGVRSSNLFGRASNLLRSGLVFCSGF